MPTGTQFKSVLLTRGAKTLLIKLAVGAWSLGSDFLGKGGRFTCGREKRRPVMHRTDLYNQELSDPNVTSTKAGKPRLTQGHGLFFFVVPHARTNDQLGLHFISLLLMET